MHITVSDLQVAYDDQGIGKVLVLLHGWGTDRQNYSELTDALRHQYRVIALDLPGFGESSMPPGDWKVDNYVNLVANFLNKLDISDPYALIVHSFGGRIAIKGLSNGLLRADKLVLIDVAGIAHDKSLRNRSYALVAKIGKPIMRLPGLRNKYQIARRKLHEQAGSTDYAKAGEMTQIFLNTIQEDLSGDARSLKLPTLIIWGSEDTETPLSDARFFHSVISGSILKIVQGAGHFVHNEQPKKVTRFIQDFLG